MNNNVDPFLLRAIEQWLDNVNELTYQSLFCFWLSTQGHKVKFSIKNTNFEQGKDVVSIDSDGFAHAYQLKGGNISLHRWRNEVKPEIEAMIDIPIKHPSIDKKIKHISYLVTNGEIDDAARVEINDLNESKWSDNKLKIITRGDLLINFQSIAYGILPKDALAYKKLIDYIFCEGTDLPDLEEISNFIYQILNIDKSNFNKQQCSRDIAAAALYTNLLISKFRIKKNYVAIVQILTILNASILYVVEKFQLEDKYWLSYFDIIFNDIQANSYALESEILINGFQSNINSVFEEKLFGFRRAAACSTVYPFKLSQFLLLDLNFSSISTTNFESHFSNSNELWSESSFLPPICLALIYYKLDNIDVSISLFQSILDTILHFNGRNSSGHGLPNPYYTLNTVAEIISQTTEKTFTESFIQRSFILHFVIDALVRMNAKDILKENWKELSFMTTEEFVPNKIEEYLLWRNRSEGVLNATILPKQIKWSDLQSQAANFTGSSLPNSLKRFPGFIPFFMCVLPHRANRDLMGFLMSRI